MLAAFFRNTPQRVPPTNMRGEGNIIPILPVEPERQDVLEGNDLSCASPAPPFFSEFNHEHLGQLNTYVSWYKKNVMTDGDNPPVGILLCSVKDHSLVEYALAGMDNSLFVSKYQLELPKKEEMQSFIEAQMWEVEK